MGLLLLPRPDHVDEGPGRWVPTVSLRRALADCRFEDPVPKNIVFEKITDGSPAQAECEGKAGGYGLEASGTEVRIRARDAEGRWNALQTLRQVLSQTDADGTLPDLKIEDSPVFPIRGVMLDVSRTRVPTMATLYRLVDMWASLKINQLQLYIEHTFAYEGHEKVWEKASPFTPAEIEALDIYCRNRGMELVPNQNSFGHMERWLRHPEYHQYAEAPEGFEDPWGVFREHASTLDLSKPQSLELLKDLYDQYLPHFSSRTFNIGGDEPYDLGKGSNREAYEAEGAGEFYLGFLKKVTDEVESRGFVPQFWADIILNYPELLDRIPEQAVVMNWGYEADHPFEKETRALADSGRVFQVCPGTSSWNSLAGRWDNARENVRSAAHWGVENGAAGLLVTDWGDNGHYQLYSASLPGWFVGAAAAWNGASGADEDIAAAIQHCIFSGSPGREAEWLMKLANLYLENPVKLHNMSFLMLPILDHDFPYYRSLYKEIAEGGMGRAREIAREAEDDLNGLSDGFWVPQLTFTAGILSFAADLAAPFYSSGDFRIENLPEDLRKNLGDRLENLMAAYSEVWQEICRPGGLEESLDGFAGLLELLRS